MTPPVVEEFTVKSEDGETRTVICREGGVGTSDLGSTTRESIWSGLKDCNFKDTGDIAYLRSDGSYEDATREIKYRRVS
jgi:hypothetical protein